MTPWTTAQVRANGIEINYHRTGGDRPPVLLLHGLTDNGACWTRLATDLEADYDLIMPDARGHGRSSVPDQGYSVEDRAADVLALIEALELDRPALLGHSMGGITAAMVAATAPARIRAAILEDPAFIAPEAWANDRAGDWSAGLRAQRALSEPELAAQGRAENPTWAPETFPLWARAKHETSPRVFDWFAEPVTDYRALVAGFGVPTLLLTGDAERGVIVPPRLAAELQSLNPLLRVAHVPGVGHCIRYEQPEQVAAHVAAFLAEVFGAAS